MKTKIIAIALSTVLTLASVMLSGCSAPTPETDLTAAVAVLDIVSVLPNLTPADKAWIAAAANGLSCSSTVLAKAEPAAQEAAGIAICFASLPVVPPADQPYITAGIAAVEVFIALFEPGATPAAVAANAKVRKMSIGDREKIIATANIEGKVKIIRGRVFVR